MKQYGFTLVELSIVLVILGLLVGGVLAGQSLIHAAELRSASTEATNFKIALGAFRGKYFAIPGDMNNAVRFWGKAAGGTADGTDAACLAVTAGATDTRTCNGNGDGYIADQMVLTQEIFRAWQHLANAGLIEGNYTGVAGPVSPIHVTFTNSPRSKVNNAGWGINGASIIGVSQFPGNYKNAIFLGGAMTDGMTYKPALKPEDQYNIDMKLDDGKPNTGSIMSLHALAMPGCMNGGETEYDLANQAVTCMMQYNTGF